MIQMVATDLDGTLLRPDETVSERTRAALAAVRRAGITLVLVTGRPPRSLRHIAAGIGVGGVAICANGALVYDLDAGVVVDQTPLAADAATRLVGVLRRALPGALFAVELEDGFRREAGWAAREAADGEVAADGADLTAAPVAKLLLRHPHLPFPEFADRVRRAVGDDAVVTWSGTRLVEISAAGVTKSFALERLCRRLGVQPEAVVAFGDMPNDLPLLAWVGHSVAVANADPEVLAAADEVTAANVDDGVAVVLERILAGRGRSSSAE
jgi:Cof subfamily protein (haloacid dehalogenase superfamily)